MTDMIRAPWTPEQVDALNAFQRRGGMHPFTCGGEHAGANPTLVARTDGWHCPGSYQAPCDYRQDWAHASMAEPESIAHDLTAALRERRPAGAAPCRTTQHCAYHGWCHRCDPAFAATMSRVNIAIQHTDGDASHWGPLYAVVGQALRGAFDPASPEGMLASRPGAGRPEDATAELSDEPEQPARTTVKNPGCSPGAEETEPNNPAATEATDLREQLHAAIERKVYEYRERTPLWGETEGVTQEIARLATRGALEVLSLPAPAPRNEPADADDETGAWTPDPPIGCLNLSQPKEQP